MSAERLVRCGIDSIPANQARRNEARAEQRVIMGPARARR
jgi:hypothetical protein